MNARFALPALLLLLTACAVAPVLTPVSPVLRAAIADAQSTETVDARHAVALALTLTAQPPTATAIALTQTSSNLKALRAAEQATREYVITQDALTLLHLQSVNEQAVVLTRAAGESEAERRKYEALGWGWQIILVGGACASVVVIMGAALRIAGPSLLHFGEGLAAKIKADGEAYAAGRNADGRYTVLASQAWATRQSARAEPPKPVIAPPPTLELGEKSKAALAALNACRDITGGKARILPKADELSGAAREALVPLKGVGLIQVQRGRSGYQFLPRHQSLDALIADIQTGAIVIEESALNA